MYLSYRSSNLQLREGAFVVGRSSNCSLRLDDGLVSRRHATFHVHGTSVTLEDLGSRNGVSVNGERLRGTRTLEDGDRIMIGSQEIVFYATEIGEASRDVGPATLQMKRERITMANLPALGDDDDEDDMTRAASTFVLIAGIADKALALGRFDEAERILNASLQGLLEREQAGERAKDKTWNQGIGFGLRLAEGPAGARWVGWLIEVHAARGVLMDATMIDRLHDLVRARRFQNLGQIRRYLEVLSERDLAAADRFRFRRLEALERVVAAV